MLKADNVTLLGGEVDTLIEANTVVNTLQAAMYVYIELFLILHS